MAESRAQLAERRGPVEVAQTRQQPAPHTLYPVLQVKPHAPLAQVARYFATYNLVALPVVDENDHLLGAVTIDDVIDHMLPADWRENDEEG